MDRDIFLSRNIKVAEITDTIFVVQGNNRSRSPFSNAICVIDERVALMDTGCGHDIIRSLSDAFPIDLVILSHSHPDHTGGTWLVRDISKAEVAVPCQCSESIASADKLASRFVSEDLTRLWKDKYLPVTGFRDFTFTSEYDDNDEFTTGRNRFIALHTPGHLQDHYCLWEPDKKILIGFDIDLSPFGPFYGNPESDIGLFKKSVERIKRLPAEIYVSSHARPMKPPHLIKRLAAYEAIFAERDRLLLAAIPEETWIGIGEIVERSPIYEVDYSLTPDPILYFGETQMVRKHLLSLAETGLITTDGQDRYRKRS